MDRQLMPPLRVCAGQVRFVIQADARRAQTGDNARLRS